MTVKAVMFDFGATLILDDRFDYFASLRKAYEVLKAGGVAPSFEEFKRVYLRVRSDLWSDGELREHTYSYRLSKVLELFGYDAPESDRRIVEATEVFTRALVDSLYMEDYVPSLLEHLHRRYRLAVVSNLGIPEVVPITLDKFGIKKYFDFLLASGTVGYRKPSPVIFNAALKALQTQPAEAVFVGDSLYHDVQGAHAVGMKTIWLRRKPNQTNEDSSVTPDRIIDDLRELPSTIEDM
ncbi:MAG: HAD family hydrolase [Candidatus Bathyarchaeia archaeon]|nr:HAD family hydrolase [Candidatus Bathyarchaeota archaeon A05DMB-4]MDH7595987.1 HAD family hydrolase [Candidatus Bathyarchaeota archaeon]